MDIVLKIDNFEGPLDLLLHLIEKKKLKISENIDKNIVTKKKRKQKQNKGIIIIVILY